MPNARPYRSVLYIPAANARAMEKAAGLPVDAIIFDLEDAVTPDQKIDARQMLAEAFEAHDYGARMRLIRINGADTEWGADDLKTAASLVPDAVLLPKVEGADMVAAAAKELAPEIAIWAMMETPMGILKASEICAADRLEGLIMGTNDLAKDLCALPDPNRLPLITALQAAVIAAKAHGCVIVDGVYNAFKDADGLRREAEQGRAFGMDGKTLIHPAQVAIANEVFAPSEADIDLARRQIAAFQEATDQGKGVAVVDGQIVENLHVATAQATLAKAEAIAKLEAA